MLPFNCDPGLPPLLVQNLNVTKHFVTYKGYKYFELNNHLGNVLSTVSDRRIGVSGSNPLLIDYYAAVIMSSSDYYAFGSPMPGRKYNAGSYRYGFNGKEKDPENGNMYDYGFRIYNPNIGKFLSVDPLTRSYPWFTPYQFAGNTPIVAIDIDGKENLWYFEDKAEELIFGTTKLKEIRQGFTERAVETAKGIVHALKNAVDPTDIELSTTGKNYNKIKQSPQKTLTQKAEQIIGAGKAVIEDYGKIADGVSKGDGKAIGAAVFEATMLFVPGDEIRFVKQTGKTTKIYRAVGLNEHADIIASKLIRPSPTGNSMETKLFSVTADDAYKQGLAMEKDFKIIEVEVSNEALEKVEKITTIDEEITQGRATYAVDPSKVEEFNQGVQKIKSTTVIKKKK